MNSNVASSLNKLIEYQQEIDILRDKQKKLQDSIAEENKKLSLQIKHLEESKITIGEKFVVDKDKTQKSFKVKHNGYELNFLNSVHHSLTQKSLKQVIGAEELQRILNNPMIKIESLKLNIKPVKLLSPYSSPKKKTFTL